MDPKVICQWHKQFFGFEKVIKEGSEPASHGICDDCEKLYKAKHNLEKSSTKVIKMENKDLNIGDILPPKKDGVEKFATSDTVIPDYIKEAAYEPQETLEQTIQEDYHRLAVGLSDYVLAEQITERELVSMGKPLPENYSEYFHATLGEVKKNRKKAEQRFLKLIPRHSQLEVCEFFYNLQEQVAKETEARERAIEVYPPAGVEKLERRDVARQGLKKEAAKEYTDAELMAWNRAHPNMFPMSRKENIEMIEAEEAAKAKGEKPHLKSPDSMEKVAMDNWDPTWCLHCSGYGSSLHEDADRCTACGGTGEAKDVAPDFHCAKCDELKKDMPQASATPAPLPESPKPEGPTPAEIEDAKKALEDVIPPGEPIEKTATAPIDDIKTPPMKHPESAKQIQTNEAATKCAHCKADIEARKGFAIGGKAYCMKCHDEGRDTGMPKTAEDMQQHIEKDINYFKEKIAHHHKVVDDLKAQLAKAEGNEALKKTLEDQIKDNTEDIAAMEKEIAERQSMKKEAAAPESQADDEKRKFFTEKLRVLEQQWKMGFISDDDYKAKKILLDEKLLKEAAGKWKPGQHLSAKHNQAAAYVVYVNEDDKTYTIKVDGVMLPSYYCWEDAHDTFDAVKEEETKDSEWAKAHGVSKTAEETK